MLQVTREQLAAMSSDPAVSHVSGDARVHRMMAVTTRAIGADQVWQGIAGLPAYTGAGIGVAIIDSGIENHRALKNRVVASFDFVGGKGRDEYGHGTHVAGIVAGESNEFPGVAPGAHIVSLRVLDKEGAGDTSDVIAAMDFAVENRARFNLRVINLSLGHPVFESYRDDPLCQAVERAVRAGMVVVAAAGNFGKTADGRPVIGGIVSPGNSPSAITVGALNTKGTAFPSDDVMATYSSRGSDGDRWIVEARARGPRQPDCRDGGPELHAGDAVPGTGGGGRGFELVHGDERHQHGGRRRFGRCRPVAAGRANADSSRSEAGAAAVECEGFRATY